MPADADKTKRELSRSERRSRGVYYTPRPVAEYILKAVGYEQRAGPGTTLVDPACGDGAFLVAAAGMLLRKLRARGMESAGLRRAVAAGIWGVDLDHAAVERARDALEALLPPEAGGGGGNDRLAFHLQAGDALLPEGGSLLAGRRFDFVVGNPPYIGSGLRGAPSRCRERQEKLRRAYPHAAQYKLNTYALFIELGIRLLKPGGRLGFLLPDSYLSGRYFSRLREYILRECRLEELSLFTRDFWDGAVVGRPSILILSRRESRPGEGRRRFWTRLLSLDTAGEIKSLAGYRRRQEDPAGEPYCRFRFYPNAGVNSLAGKLGADSQPLGRFLIISSGLIGRAGQRAICAPRRLSRAWRPGLLKSSQVERYRIDYRGDYICWDRACLKSGFEKARYAEPKLLLRQTGDSLIAAYDANGLLCLNNLHVLNARCDGEELWFFLALLNSSLFNAYYRLLTAEAGRVFAQVDIETLAAMPVKSSPPAARRYLGELARRRTALSRSGTAAAAAESAAIDAAINEAVRRLYGISLKQEKQLWAAVNMFYH